MKRWFGKVLSIVMAAVLLSACGNSDVGDQIANVVQSEDEHVLGVKGGTPNAYPDKTYEEAFENFFGSPTWKYFVGTKEGPDEDGDGKPDYTEDNVDIVEFTGYCTYQDVEVKALIQFTLSKDDNTFEATYLSFNEVPQNMLMLSALLEAAFTEGEIEAAVENNSNEPEQEMVLDESEEEDVLLQDYYRAAFVGTWIDTAYIYQMDISFEGDTYVIMITSQDNDYEWRTWSLENTSGKVDDVGNLYYSGVYVDLYPREDGTVGGGGNPCDAGGVISFTDDGMLEWFSTTGELPSSVLFTKS